jgi:hypothetical protein
MAVIYASKTRRKRWFTIAKSANMMFVRAVGTLIVSRGFKWERALTTRVIHAMNAIEILRKSGITAILVEILICVQVV